MRFFLLTSVFNSYTQYPTASKLTCFALTLQILTVPDAATLPHLSPKPGPSSLFIAYEQAVFEKCVTKSGMQATMTHWPRTRGEQFAV